MNARRWVSRVRTPRRRRPRAYIPLAVRIARPDLNLNRAGHAVLAPDVDERATDAKRESIETIPEDG